MLILLKTKPWLLFVILYGLPFFFLVGPPLAVAVYSFVRLTWLWSVGVALHSKLPPDVKMNVRIFKIAFMLPVVDVILTGATYIVFLLLHMFGVDDASATLDIILFYLIPLHLLAILGFIYTLWFNSRLINSVEQKRSVSVIDCLADFFAIWFFIVGVWLVQGRVNEIMGTISPEAAVNSPR